MGGELETGSCRIGQARFELILFVAYSVLELLVFMSQPLVLRLQVYLTIPNRTEFSYIFVNKTH